ncbi:hypothetical protein [Luteolibacter sp. Populi]|uniref:hypothetical protein n=1 Tax=Luteolibacter sp. Populi TaxID=3230487 RepID=UPI0034675A15
MDSTPPLPASGGPPPFPPAPGPGTFEPGAVKVFGVMHLIFAAMGLFWGLYSLFSPFLAHLFVSPKDPSYELQMKLQADLKWVNLGTGVMVLVLAGLMLVAGLKLIRSDPDGVKWSILYAWISIASKIISAIVGVLVVVPATKAMMRGVFESSGMPAGMGGQMASIMDTMMSVSGVASPLISCTYPALVIYFFTRPGVKAWCAALRPSAS